LSSESGKWDSIGIATSVFKVRRRMTGGMGKRKRSLAITN
jgi:hypothetical protein